MNKRLKIAIDRPVSIREKVYAVIRNDILNGRISPGERMVETRLAKQIKTSRTPVREALHMLEREGLLESIPRVGYRVKQIEWNEVEEICEIRAVNETLAARWAMERMTSKEIHALEENVALSKRELKEKDPRAFVSRDAEFHEILVRASGSRRLSELCEMFRRHMLRYRLESLYLPETVLRAITWHHRIIECIKKKDHIGVKTAIHKHLEQSKKDIYRYAFPDKGEKNVVSEGKQ